MGTPVIVALFSLGINYWPRRSAMWMWSSFDRGELAEDFARIAELGLDTVRFFLLWEAFAPERDRIDTTMLRRLETVVDLLHERGLRAMPTLFCGHMSGVNFVPGWALDPSTDHGRFRTISGGVESPYGIGDFYAGPLVDAQRLACDALGRAMREHPAIVAWDLGNEFSNLREPRTAGDAAQWSATLTATLQAASHLPVTGGLHGEDLSRDRNIRPSSIAAPWTFATMHGYPVYSSFARNRLDADVCPFLATLAADFSRKRVLFSELGNPTCPPDKQSPYDREPLPDEPPAPPVVDPDRYATYACLTENEMAAYASEVLDRLHGAGALGAYWWCWADYVSSLADRAPFDRATHELSFGIIRNDGTAKTVCEALAAFARERREVAHPNGPAFDEDGYYRRLPGGIDDAYAAYLALAR